MADTPSPIIKDQKRDPCGCVITRHADGKVTNQPCETHKPLLAMMAKIRELTGALNEASQAIGIYAKIIMAYQIIAQGCPKHPAYRTNKRPISDCRGGCQKMWRARAFLDRLKKQALTRAMLPRQHRTLTPEPPDQKADAEAGEAELITCLRAGDASPFVPKLPEEGA